MPDSVGAGGFPNNINIGHEHLDISSGFTYQYAGGVPSNILNWKIIGGVTPTDPSTVGWGAKQIGAEWFNTSINRFMGWNGSQIITLMTLEEQVVYFKSQLFIEDDFVSGTTLNSTMGALNWGVFSIGSGSVSIVQPSASPLDAGRVGIIALTAAAGGIGNGVDVTMSQIGNYTWTPDLSYDMTFNMRPVDTDTDTLVRIGAGFETNLEPPTLGNYFEKAFADTTWFAVTNDIGITRLNTGIPFTAQWITGRIRRLNSTTIRFTLNEQDFDISTDLSGASQAFQVFMLLKTNSVASKTFRIDYMSLRISRLQR